MMPGIKPRWMPASNPEVTTSAGDFAVDLLQIYLPLTLDTIPD
jgi:hypothetical protein